jgi:Xaa-Pro aminopeptidase
VHEGPVGFGPRYGAVALEPGMIISNEPGYYEAGAFGVRIENLVLVVESKIGDGKFLELETLTLCPIDTRLIDEALLTPAERDWLNAYHKRVFREIGGELKGEDKAWLKEATRTI